MAKTTRTELIKPIPWLTEVIAEAAGDEMNKAYQISHKQTRGKAVDEIRTRIVADVLVKHEAEGVTATQVSLPPVIEISKLNDVLIALFDPNSIPYDR